MCGGQKTDLTITQTFTMETTINGLVSVLGCMQRGALGTWSMLAYNVKVLCVCGGLVAPTVGTAQKPNRITAVDLSTSTAITQNTCYAQCFFVELIKLKL